MLNGAQRAIAMQKEHNSPRVHYAWVICGACTLMLFVAMGLNSNVFTVYQPYILSRYGFSNTQCSLLILLLIRDRPEELGLRPYTTGEEAQALSSPPPR